MRRAVRPSLAASTLRLAEGMLAILLAGGIAPRAAAWGIDALTLYVNAYTWELPLLSRSGDEWAAGREEVLRRFAQFPDAFPQTKRYAAELASGAEHERFDFTIGLILDGLTRR